MLGAHGATTRRQFVQRGSFTAKGVLKAAQLKRHRLAFFDPASVVNRAGETNTSPDRRKSVLATARHELFSLACH